MQKQQQKQLLNELLSRKKSLEEKLHKIAEENPEIKDDWKAHYHTSDQSDTNDEKAHSVTDYEVERALEQRLELELKEVNEAIKKMNSGTYGKCVNCETRIQHKRLKVVPTAKFCVECAEKVSLV